MITDDNIVASKDMEIFLSHKAASKIGSIDCYAVSIEQSVQISSSTLCLVLQDCPSPVVVLCRQLRVDDISDPVCDVDIKEVWQAPCAPPDQLAFSVVLSLRGGRPFVQNACFLTQSSCQQPDGIPDSHWLPSRMASETC